MSPRARAALARLAALLALAGLANSCAYYNTFYLARKYYFRATDGAPYLVDAGNAQRVANTGGAQNFQKAIDYSKKLIANYPKSKWVDDAYLLWARSLLGKDDPLKTVEMLREFTTRYPNSPATPEARFYLGVANRQARRYADAVFALNAFLEDSPKHALAPYAHLERARALMSLDQPAKAAEAAGRVLEQFPKSELVTRARLARAEALFAQGDFAKAREDYRYMGAHAPDDQQRLDFLLEESDCLEAGRQYDEALGLLRGALSHEKEPARPDTTGGRPIPPMRPEDERWGRLTMRIGGVQVRAGDLPSALASYQRVLDAYPKTSLGAEAQYRVAYAYETVGDDFERARAEYPRVREQQPSSAFVSQAEGRLASLNRLAQFKSASGDTLERIAEQGLMRAELYLFQLDKPDRALEEYGKIAAAMPGTPYAGKALNAQGWVLSRKLDRREAADSLFWKVVREYPATEAQLAARDYLEAGGAVVPDSLIRLPVPKPVVRDTVALTPTPEAPALGAPAGGIFGPRDSTGTRLPGANLSPRPRNRGSIFAPGDPRYVPPPDSTDVAHPSLVPQPLPIVPGAPRPDSSGSKPDSARGSAPDSARTPEPDGSGAKRP